MNQFLFTLDDDPTVHAAPIPVPVEFYCSRDEWHEAHQSEALSVTCEDCITQLKIIWLGEFENPDPGKQIILQDHKGTAILRDWQLKQGNRFIEFTADRGGGNVSRCFYRTERLLSMVIDARARLFTPAT